MWGTSKKTCPHLWFIFLQLSPAADPPDSIHGCFCVSHNSLFEGLFLFWIWVHLPLSCCDCSLSPPSLLSSPKQGWLPHWKHTALSLTLPCSAICLSLFLSDSDEFTEWMRWELNYMAGSSQAPASQHSTHRSGICRCLTEGSTSRLPSKIIQAQDPLTGCQNHCFHGLTSYHRSSISKHHLCNFHSDQRLSGKSPPLFTPWLANRCIIYNLTDLTLFTSCSMKQTPPQGTLLKAFRFLIQK